MMSLSENAVWWIGVIGSVASIGSAVWAFLEARKARDAASEAERVRDEIVQRRRIIEASGVHRETQRVLTVLSKVGPSSDPIRSKGIRSSDLADEVRTYLLLLNEHLGEFSSELKSGVLLLVETTKVEIQALAEAKSFEAKRTAATSIYYKIQGLMPQIKSLADEKKERSMIKE